MIGGGERETFWWCEEAQEVIRSKKVAYRARQRSQTSEDEIIYRARKKEAKRLG